MSAPNDGGPAFPLPFIFDPTRGETGLYIDGEDAGAPTGLSVRDYFAAKAMQGYCANPDEAFAECPYKDVACWAYKQADAMLAAREAKR